MTTLETVRTPASRPKRTLLEVLERPRNRMLIFSMIGVVSMSLGRLISGNDDLTSSGTFGTALRTAGKNMRTVVPWPGSDETVAVPPDCRAKPYTIDRPRPVPLPSSFVVKKGSITRVMISGAMPLPVSVTDSAA